ncbi:MAG: enoyl-CoA hydratase/isomerase family protein, partial [Acidobacteriota bacterium]|nr:enoyl-CoA hydratase/isomerase family protein [Acidobacteriota bacterium]
MTVAEMKTVPEPEFKVDVQDRVALLTFNRPKKLNALSAEITAGLQEEVPRLAADPDVGVIVLTGEGRAFCAGGDVSGMGGSGGAPTTLEERIDSLRRGQEAAWLVHSVPKVTIAMVNGF